MEQSRRAFLKSSLFAAGFLALAPRFLECLPTARAAEEGAQDAKINRQGYTRVVPPKKVSDQKKYARHSAKSQGVKPGVLPNCKNCKQFKPIAGQPGWGKVRHGWGYGKARKAGVRGWLVSGLDDKP